MATDTLVFAGELMVVTCWCGIRHGVPSELRRHQLAERVRGRQFGVYCPLGHEYIPGSPSETDRLKKQLENERSYASNLLARLDQERASHASTKGKLTKTRKRIANGVCPCCHRSFEQLARHITTKHPGYRQTSGDTYTQPSSMAALKEKALEKAAEGVIALADTAWRQGHPYSQAANALQQLMVAGELVRTGRGVYTLPGPSH
jgi:hypothetical protein